MNETVAERVWEIAEPVVTQEGLEMVDVEYRRESRGMVLRLYLDRDGGVSLDDLSRVSRQIGDLLDVHDAVPGSYTLEVSSPGVNRRLRRREHFHRYLGRKVRVRTVNPVNGRRAFVGILEAVEAEGIRLQAHDGNQFIGFAEIAQANYEPES
ncbi:MAG: ribosome maturation factor RimP [Acidobacteriia bacterium]|nr:ribosome maturation factor RimP [Terriglobia bacterium]